MKLQKEEEQAREEVAVDVTRLLLILLLALSISQIHGQSTDYVKKKVSKTDINLITSYYEQEGNNSAVTGGEGTEKLAVYGNKIGIDHQIDSINSYAINVQADFVTSASTDNIDFNVSSASRKDWHIVFNFAYERNIPNSAWSWGSSIRYSAESDYYSYSGGLWFSNESKDKSRVFSMHINYFLDDLRWRTMVLDPTSRRFLVYPEELRGTNWFDRHLRHTYNVSTSWKKDLNRKMNITIFPYFSLQHGLLSTPFHRVYFNDNDLRVENLPIQKYKGALGVQYNSFLGDRTTLRSFFRFYLDSFGVTSGTSSLQTTVKISPVFWTSIFYRAYRQSGSRFFAPKNQHDSLDSFYTSDYDLSSFWSHKVGAGFKFHPYQKTIIFEKLSLRFARYWRGDGLSANMISTHFDL